MARGNSNGGFRRHGLVANAVLAVFSLLVFATAIDLVAFYLLDIKYPGYKPERFFQHSDLTGHVHKPNAKGKWYRYYDGTKFTVRTNEHGFADSERTIEKKRPRIALIGDSVVEFWEVEEEHRGQHVIERLLDGAYEVLTFGVRDFGTDQTFLLFTNVGVHFSPDIVVYTFCINDVWDNVDTASKPHFVIDLSNPEGLTLEGYPVPKKPASKDVGLFQRFKRYSLVYRKLDFGWRLARSRVGRPVVAQSVPLEEHFELRPYKKDYDAEDKLRMVITTRLIGLMADFIESQGMKFLVVEGLYKPVLDEQWRKLVVRQYGDVFDFDKVSSILDDFCAREGINFLSLPRIVEQRDARVSDFMHYDDTLHLNEEGIRFYSGAVVEKLRSLGWIENKGAIR